MQFSDCGYIVNLKKHGENSLIVTVVCKDHGKLIGYCSHCYNKKSAPVFQLGNFVKINAYSRLEENMLSFKLELITPHSVDFMFDEIKLSVLSSFCELCNTCLPEKEPLERFYWYVESFFNLIHQDNWLTHYCYFEFYLLEYLGIGLDLSECSATGSTQNLQYVSPKTAKAVCAQAGEPFKDRLFAYPHFIVSQNYCPSPTEQKQLLQMTEFFLNKNFFQTHNLKLPKNRASLLAKLNLE